MKLVEVKTPQQQQEFVRFPVTLYKDAPAYIQPLDKDVENVFHKDTNKTFRQGEAIRWILQNDQGKTIGRVAAFINRKIVNKDNDQPTGGMGFFECIDDKEAAFKLFDAAKEWLAARDMEAMDGPVNFGERNEWWGLLVDGFEVEPLYKNNYHLPYYQAFFEEYGFEVYFRQFTYGRKMRAPLSPKLAEKAYRIFDMPGYEFKHLRKAELEKFTEDFRTVYNAAWGGHAGVASLSSLQAKALMKQMKPIMDEKIMWFGYHDGKPIAIFIMIPEVNQLFKYVGGKLDLIGKVKFMYHKMKGSCKKAVGLIFGIAPEYQGKGMEGAIIEAARVMVQEEYPRYDDLEMNWIGDFNPRMIKVVEQVGGDVVKTHHTYRFLFDRTKEFKRAPILGAKRSKDEQQDA